MNRQDGNMYEFVTHTSNPIKGLCPHDCIYCYMKPIYNRFKHNPNIRLDLQELQVNLGKGHFVFLGSSTDMFADAVPTDWILKVYDHCNQYEQNKYLFQSKNPIRFFDPGLINHPLMQKKGDVFFATTLETNRERPIVSNAQSMSERMQAMGKLREAGFDVMITMEPIMDFDLSDVMAMMQYVQPFQVNIGCNTSKTVILPEPSKEKIVELVNALRQYTRVKLKSNSNRILGNWEEYDL